MNSPLKRDYIVLFIVVFASASYVYVTMANAAFYIDEETYARVGYSLLQGHLASDSGLLWIYQKLGLVRDDILTPFGYKDSVEPWLDAPPLVPLLLVPLLALGASPRLLPVIFSSLDAVLIFFLFRHRRLLAWVSALAWTGLFISHQILSMLFIDAGVSFFNLLTLTMTSEYTRSRSRSQLYLAGVAAGASALSKIFGIASLLYFLGYLLYLRVGRSRESLSRNSRPFLIAVVTASTWPIVGLAVAAPLFIQILQFNASRSVLSNNGFNLPVLASFNYTQSTMYHTGIDPVLVMGWVSIAYSISKKNLGFVHLSLLSYLLVVVILRYAWFYTTIPLFPFLSIGMGSLITDLICYLRGGVLKIFTKSERLLQLKSGNIRPVNLFNSVSMRVSLASNEGHLDSARMNSKPCPRLNTQISRQSPLKRG